MLYTIHCMNLITGKEEPSCRMASTSYPWRDLAHQMETVAMLNLDADTHKLLYFIKNEEPIRRWGE